MKRILINGKPYEVSDDELTFMELVMLANYEVLFIPTVTYRNEIGGGILPPNGKVVLEDGMSFSIAYTDSA
jgi:hypothetical protein